MKNFKINYHKFIYPIIIFTSVLLADQFSKAISTYLYNHAITTHKILGNFISFQYITNTGVAFSSGQGHQLIFNTIAIILVILSLWVSAYLITSFFSIGLLLMSAGALSNCIERIASGKVTDFIQLNLFGWTFPGIFNIADSCVCVGAAVVILGILLFNSEERIFDTHDEFVFIESAELKVVNQLDHFEHQKSGPAHLDKMIHKAEHRILKEQTRKLNVSSLRQQKNKDLK